MGDVDTKPVEVVEPPVTEPPTAEVVETKADDSEAKAVDEPTNEPTTGENGTKEDEAEGTTADDDKPSIFRPPTGMLRVTGPRQQKKFVKSDPSSLAETDDPREIRKQVSPLPALLNG
jgi:hypothetical protein